MSLAQSKSSETALPLNSPTLKKQTDLDGLFKTFKNIRSNESLPEPLKTQQLRAHAALIYQQLDSKSQTVSS